MKLKDTTAYEEQVFDELEFQQQRVQSSTFEYCKFLACDFFETDLTDARFNLTKLDNCNFKEATGYFVNPLENSIEGASFSLPDVLGLLSPFKIKIDDY